jgi:hypothetical protein
MLLFVPRSLCALSGRRTRCTARGGSEAAAVRGPGRLLLNEMPPACHAGGASPRFCKGVSCLSAILTPSVAAPSEKALSAADLLAGARRAASLSSSTALALSRIAYLSQAKPRMASIWARSDTTPFSAVQGFVLLLYEAITCHAT